jgi:putative spermidine/putrescine transport system permease protein
LIAVFSALVVLPVLASVVYSLLYSLGLTGLLAKGFTFEHWLTVFREGSFLQSLLFSACMAMVSISLAVSIALYLAWTFRKELRSHAVSYFLFLPLAVPAVVAAFFSFQLMSQSGLLSRIAFALGLTSDAAGFPALVNDRLGIGIMLTHIFLAIPYFTMLFRNIFRQEDLPGMIQMGENLGVARAVCIRRILIPISLHKASASVFMFAIFVAGSYEIPLLLGASDRRMLSPLVADKMFRFNLADKPEAHVMLVLYMLFIFVIAARYTKRIKDHAL